MKEHQRYFVVYNQGKTIITILRFQFVTGNDYMIEKSLKEIKRFNSSSRRCFILLRRRLKDSDDNILEEIRNIKLPCQDWFNDREDGPCAITCGTYCKRIELPSDVVVTAQTRRFNLQIRLSNKHGW